MKKILWLCSLFIFGVVITACGGEAGQEVVEVTRVVKETVTEEVEVTRVVEAPAEEPDTDGNANDNTVSEENNNSANNSAAENDNEPPSAPANDNDNAAPSGGGGGGQAANDDSVAVAEIDSNTANFGAYEGAEVDTRFSFGGGGGPGPESTCMLDENSAGQFYLLPNDLSLIEVKRIDDTHYSMGVLVALACRMPTVGMSVVLTTPSQETVTLPASVDEYGLISSYLVPLGDNYGTYVATFVSSAGEEVGQVSYTLESKGPQLSYKRSGNEFLALWGFPPNERVRLVFYETRVDDLTQLVAWQEAQINAEGYLVADINLPYAPADLNIVVIRPNGDNVMEAGGFRTLTRVSLTPDRPFYSDSGSLNRFHTKEYIFYAEAGQVINAFVTSGNGNVELSLTDLALNELPVGAGVQIPQSGDYVLEVWNNGDVDTTYTMEVGLVTVGEPPLDDPYLVDTDGDGLSDGEEIDTTLTDPNNPDSDDDGRYDGDEIALNTDPNDPNNADDVSLVTYPGGQFIWSGVDEWTETNNSGSATYQEAARDPWSIYLYDGSRDLAIQLDLWTMEVKCTSAPCAAPVLYPIERVSRGLACPFVFTFDETAQTWTFDTTIITKLVGPENERQQWRELQRFNGRLQIREVESEISHLDQVFVVLVDETGRETVLSPDVSLLQAADDAYLVMQQGDQIELTFSDYDPTFTPVKVWVVAEGYYEPLTND